MQPSEERRRSRAFAVSSAAASLTILDLTKVNVALPTIETRLGAGPVELQLIVAGYALAFGLLLVPSGRLGDLGSRKRLFLVGVVAFGTASLLCGLAPSAAALACARAFQGAAAGVLMPQVFGAIQQLYPAHERGRAFGLFGAITGLSTAFGPTLAGLLIELGGPELGWRLAFWINVPIVLGILPFAVTSFPSAQQRRARMTLDPVGILLLGAAAFSLMLPFVFTSGQGHDDPARWLWLLGAGAATATFIAWERAYRARGHDPVLDFALLRYGSYRNGLLIISSYYAALPSVFIVTTLFLQQGLGLSAFLAGMVSIPFTLASGVSSAFSGRLLSRLDRRVPRLALLTALLGFALVLVMATTLPAAWVPWGIAAVMTIAGLGGGVVVASNQTLMLHDVPLSQAGVAGSVGQLGQRVGNAIGVAMVSSTYFATLVRSAPGETGYQLAVRNGLGVALGFVLLALLISLADRGRAPRPGERRAPRR